MNFSLGRTEVAVISNQSGGFLAYGTVVIVDTANALAFTTTSTPGYLDGRIGVVLDVGGIADTLPGLIAFSGFIPQINLDGSAAIGDLVKTSSTPGEGTPHNAPFVSGDFAQVLETGTTPSALLFGIVQQPVTSSFTAEYILLQDIKASGSDGGTFTSGSWVTRILNTEVVDEGGNCSLSSNQFTLAAGTYEYKISCPAFRCDNHQAVLYNVTDAAIVAYGTSEISGPSDATGTRSWVAGKMTLAAPKVFEVQHQCIATQATNGLGVGAGLGSELYTIAELWRTA